MDDIKVSIFRRTGERIWQMQYRDPAKNKKHRRSTKATNRRDAERAAAKWEADVIAGRGKGRFGRMAWSDFRTKYEDEVVSSFAEKTDEKISAVFNVLEGIINPARLCDLNEANLSKYQAELRVKGRAESTIKSHLGQIKAALSWAVDQKLLPSVPNVKLPRRAKGQKVMKGRPITTEEFERMLSKVKDTVGKGFAEDRRDDLVDSWKHYLHGMWFSGLRLSESMELHWEDRNRLCVENLDGREPMLWIPGELEKGNQDRILPMAPEFAEFLRETPDDNRVGYVFNPQARRARYGDRLTPHYVGKVVVKIGKAAGVKVDSKASSNPESNELVEKAKFASAHDLRRSFGERWSSRVMPQVLMELMRHENVETTMRFYVGQTLDERTPSSGKRIIEKARKLALKN